MKHFMIAGVVVVAVMCVLSANAGLGFQKPPQPPPPTGTEFKGKIIVVYTKNQAAGPMLEKAGVRELGQRFFLVGKVCDERARWAGSTIWLAMDEVSMIAAFDTIDEARKAAK